jgi:hypothetical protein
MSSNQNNNKNPDNNAPPPTAAAAATTIPSHPFGDNSPQTPVITANNTTSASTSMISPLQQSVEHDEVAAANAEAMRLAIELGVASSVRNARKRGTLRQLLSPTPLANSLSPKSSSSLFPTLQQQQQQHVNINNTTNINTLDSSAFQPVPSDVMSTSAAALMGQYQNSLFQQQQQQQQGNVSRLPSIASASQYRPPSIAYRSISPSMQSASSYAQSEGSQSLHMFDCHGQRTPYREGPYFVHHEKDGRRIKKRWCTYRHRMLMRSSV